MRILLSATVSVIYNCPHLNTAQVKYFNYVLIFFFLIHINVYVYVGIILLLNYVSILVILIQLYVL
jgi:hypothetical protein